MQSPIFFFFLLVLFLNPGCYSSHGGLNDSQNEKTIKTGYTEEKDKNFTGSASKVENLEPYISLEDHLRKLPGVTVSGSGANCQVRVRGGSNSFQGSNEPLFVVDGKSFSSFRDVNAFINVPEIKSVTVLKDASTTSMYGSRGANGVIVIKTKTE